MRIVSALGIRILWFPESFNRSADEGLETLDRKVSQGQRANKNLHSFGDHWLDRKDTSNEQQQRGFGAKCRWTVDATTDVKPLQELM